MDSTKYTIKENLSQLSNDLLKNVDKDKVQKLRKKFISQSFSLSYWKPLYITHGRGQYLYDDKGKKYLDAINNPACWPLSPKSAGSYYLTIKKT